MQPQSIGPPVERPVVDPELGLEARFPGKYLSLTSFKRDGTGVATPVWFVVDDPRLLVKTGRDSLKVSRIRRNPAVLIAILILPIYRALQRLRGARADTAEVVLAITPTSAASTPNGSEKSS